MLVQVAIQADATEASLRDQAAAPEKMNILGHGLVWAKLLEQQPRWSIPQNRKPAQGCHKIMQK